MITRITLADVSARVRSGPIHQGLWPAMVGLLLHQLVPFTVQPVMLRDIARRPSPVARRLSPVVRRGMPDAGYAETAGS